MPIVCHGLHGDGAATRLACGGLKGRIVVSSRLIA